jgi:uncharacterized membrane protein
MTEYYSVTEVAALTGLSRRTVIRKFERMPGVLLLCDRPETRNKRRYRTFRIPKSMVEAMRRQYPSTKPPILC